MKKIRVFIVDDSTVIVKILEKIFIAEKDMEVAGIALNGKEAIEKIPVIKPDVITLDIQMPIMDGMEVIKYLMRNYPIPILVFSSLTWEGAEITNQALIEGALDFMPKPQINYNFEELKQELLKKIRIISNVKVIKRIDIKKSARKVFRKKITATNIRNKIIGIGVSTGGPRALYSIIPLFKKHITVPIVIAQHMPPKFTKILAGHLNENTHYNVKEAEDNEKIKEGYIYIGPGGKNFIVTPDKTFKIIEATGHALPSVDILFESLAQIYGKNVIGVILTGMGQDGLIGARKIKEKGGIIIAESEETAVIFGMPKKVIENNLADKVAKLNDVPHIIMEYL